MQIKQILLIGIFLALNLFPSLAQNSTTTTTITGKVTDESGEPLAGAFIKILNTGISAPVDVDGLYKLQKINTGKHIIQVFSLGMKTLQKEIEVYDEQTIELNFKLAPDSKQMKEVLVMGKSTLQEVGEQAFTGGRV